MQNDDESYRAEQEQGRHQHQPHNQEIKTAPWGIFGAWIEHDRSRSRRGFNRWLELQFRKRMIW